MAGRTACWCLPINKCSKVQSILLLLHRQVSPLHGLAFMLADTNAGSVAGPDLQSEALLL